jgi:hypothetical protein
MNRSARAVSLVIAALVLVVPALAQAHIERAAYWPDPAPDRSVRPAAGGRVPDYRPLASALDDRAVGRTRVVCQRDSLRRLDASIGEARTRGYRLRPSEPARAFTAAEAAQLVKVNRALERRCSFGSIQAAINASGNNDRVVILPGVYTEPRSRAAPTHDPKCKPYEIPNDRNQTVALSYEYQYRCPNDQSLVRISGRNLGPGKDPAQPRWDRHGIPNAGRCIRCNLQIEGSGVSPDDVVIDAGRVASGDGGPASPAKDVVILADRADGFVLRNVKVRHAREHGVYVLETDGYRLDRVKLFYNMDYGTLTFASDHGLTQDCEATGSGDSGVYPGGAPETGDTTVEATRRYNQEIRRCDLHHNALGYSATDGNAIHVHDNDFYDNAQAISMDVFTAAGHPGFPQNSSLFEHNNIYSNNFNPYVAGSDVAPTVPVPVGNGGWVAGGNHNVFRYNRIYDNWRRGFMLFAVPDAVVCTPTVDTQHGCDPMKMSTSYNNEFYGNTLGVGPDGKPAPNGLDFWWDQYPGNTGNCWHDNGGATSEPPALLLPTGCGSSSSVGTGNALHQAELILCLGAIASGGEDPCPWFTTPPKPAKAGAA